jgi:hypothetical protein
VQQTRASYAAAAAGLDLAHGHALDEAAMRLGETRSHRLSRPGRRIEEAVPHEHGEEISMLRMLTLSGVSTSGTVEGTVDAEVVVAYVAHVLVPVLVAGAVVLIDKLRVHPSTMASAFERAGARGLKRAGASPTCRRETRNRAIWIRSRERDGAQRQKSPGVELFALGTR